ncbi:MAG: histidine phosphatase family protein [Saprospiraceae bacterium]
MKFSSIIFLFILLGAYACVNKQKISLRNSSKNIKSIQSEKLVFEDETSFQIPIENLDKVFYLTRHAEKDTTIATDPRLTEAGYARASKLADILMGTRIDAIYSTLYMRTMLTVDSVADVKMMSILPYENSKLRETIDDISDSDKYNRILMVGHSNTIPSITNSIAKKEIYKANFDESDYSNFIIVTIYKDGTRDTYTLKY